MGEGGVYNVPQGEEGVIVQYTNLNPFPSDPPLKKLEAKYLVQPIHLRQNPGCYPDAELIQFRKGIVVCRQLCVMLWFDFNIFIILHSS